MSIQKVPGILLFALCFITATAVSARAETVSYPEKNPLFTVEVPAGWKAKHENGAITIAAEANAVVLLQHVDNVKDESAAKAAVPQLADLQGKQFNMQGVRIAVPARATQVGDFKGFMIDGRGTDRAGNDTLWQVMIFAAKDDDYYVVTCLWTNDDAEKTAADRAEIFKSLKAATS